PECALIGLTTPSPRPCEPEAAAGEIERDDVFAHEWLDKVAIHDHVSDDHRAVDRHAGSNVVLEVLFLAGRVEAEDAGVFLCNQRNATSAGVEDEPRHAFCLWNA